MPEKNRNLWAPWRIAYLRSLGDESAAADGCFLCAYAAGPADDAANQVIWRTTHSLVLMNRFPYTNGHLLIAPRRHVATLADLDDAELDEHVRLTRDAMELVGHTVRADGFNVGMNFGRCAGAGLPGHLHAHVVPRWSGDTNFVPVLDGARIISQSMAELFDELVAQSKSLGLPRIETVNR